MDSTLDSKLRMWEDDAENFLGEDLDKEKEMRVNRIGELCEQIANRESFTKATLFPISERSKNATVSLDTRGFLFDRGTLDALAELLKLADDVSFASVDGTTRISFGVHDMWKKHSYINDLEHNPDEWHGKLKLIK